MLKKHIRTHTDVRPYHCTYCNFSFKTKGNLTKHMKSKTHSKKCVDLGVSVGLIDEQDTEESDEKQRFTYERSGYDLEESDGPDEEDNENEDEDEDSQAESVLSAAPSATASPQHLPARSSPQDPGGADEDGRIPKCFPGGHTDPMDVLPTKMTVLSAVRSDHCRKTGSLERSGQQAAGDEGEAAAPTDSARSPEAAPRSPCHQMSVDYPESEEIPRSSVAGEVISLTQSPSSPRPPPPAAQRSPQTGGGPPPASSPPPAPQAQKPPGTLHPPPGLPSPQTHLFSHLPLHSQQQSRTPYNLVPVGGIQVVPAGLTYSTFVPIQAGPMQLTIPAVNVIHRTVGPPGDLTPEVSGTTEPAGVTELSSVLPCIPIGQIRVPGLQPLSMETVNLVGARPPSIALKAVGLQVLTADPCGQGSPGPPAPVPGLQILNIALPALIPSVGRVPVDTPETPATQNRAREAQPQQPPAAGAQQGGRTTSPQGSPRVRRENAKKVLDLPAPAGDHSRLESSSQRGTGKTGPVNHVKPQHEPPARPGQPASAPPPALPLDRRALRPPAPPTRRQAAPQLSDLSSDDDEDRLVIAT